MQFIDNEVVSRIYGDQRGRAFSANEILAVGRDDFFQKPLSGLELNFFHQI